MHEYRVMVSIEEYTDRDEFVGAVKDNMPVCVTQNEQVADFVATTIVDLFSRVERWK